MVEQIEQKLDRLQDQVNLLQTALIEATKRINVLDRDRKDLWELIGNGR